MNRPRLVWEVVVSDMFGQNSYLASIAGREDCLIVDPGFDAERIIARIEAKGGVPAAILNTHGHADHIAGNAALKQRWPDCPLVIGAAEAFKLTDPVANLSAPFGFSLISPPADVHVREGDVYRAAGIELEVLETPGHSPGHLVFLWKGDSPWIAFDGDVLFEGSVGRTDFPDGNPQQLVQSIRQKLYTLPDDTLILSGHGEPTTIGREKRTNPFVRG